MHKILIISILALCANLTVKGQNLFLIGEKSYPCTNAIKLESNADYGADLDVFFAKEGKSGLFGVSFKCRSDEKFTGKLIVYLEDGSVLTCNESVVSERVDDLAKAVYSLTDDQLNKLKISNIHTVKYTMLVPINAENFSASNTGVKTNAIISDFFGTGQESIVNDKSADSLKSTDESEEEEAEPFMYVEQMPTFPGGQEAMYTYIYQKLEYPAVARESGISGTVVVQFVVSKEGEIQKPKVARGLGGGCNEEALRIVNSMPKWNPAMHNGRTVPVTFTLPIKFSL
jgi:TonB family protein